MAAQLMATKGPRARGESWCSARLISSLPVPLSPRTSTVVSVAAARWRASIASFRAGSSPRTSREAEAALVLLLEEDQLGHQPAPLHRPVQQQEQVVGVDRLREEVGGALLHRPHRLLHRAVGGHDDDRGLGVRVPGRLEHVEAAPGRQLQVGEDDAVAGGPGGGAGPRRRRRPRRPRTHGTPGSSAAWCGATPCPRRSGCRPRGSSGRSVRRRPVARRDGAAVPGRRAPGAPAALGEGGLGRGQLPAAPAPAAARRRRAGSGPSAPRRPGCPPTGPPVPP